MTITVATALVGHEFSAGPSTTPAIGPNQVTVFRASRWTKGNPIWPAQVAVLPEPGGALEAALFGQFEETIGTD